MAELDQAHESYELGMHTEQLSGRTQPVSYTHLRAHETPEHRGISDVI